MSVEKTKEFKLIVELMNVIRDALATRFKGVTSLDDDKTLTAASLAALGIAYEKLLSELSLDGQAALRQLVADLVPLVADVPKFNETLQ